MSLATVRAARNASGFSVIGLHHLEMADPQKKAHQLRNWT